MNDLLSLRFEKQPHMVTRRVAGEVILVPIVRQVSGEPSLYTLDEVATFLWECLDGRHTGWDLIGILETRYQVEKKQTESDVRLFLEQLQSIEAIRPLEENVEKSERREI
jgi:hypothetical protein